ncbi:hypothetical protein ABW19_dt0202553 [Dactylella cylindrospora]|nr:hypothetical protein ABW19_dt0202553 [Dactylella cylindrospora]
MNQYFPPYCDVAQERDARGDLADAHPLATLANLATSQDPKSHSVESDHFGAGTSSGGMATPTYYDDIHPRSYVNQLRQRTDIIPKQPISFNHMHSQDVYAMSKLQLSHTPTTAMSPTSPHGPSHTTHSMAHSLDSDLFSAPKCSYVEDCNTSSPLRKVVSHIFGRNKLSTRQIPKNIWVYYCRKHYQRSRYRDPKGFAKLQCDLVRRQVERLAAWGGVEDWVIKVRRREEIRISKESRAVMPHSPAGSDEFDDDYAQRDSALHGPSDIHWISLMTGSGKSVDDVRYLLHRIETEIIDRGGVFPDVEILPNVRPSALAHDGDALSRTQTGESDHSLATIPEGSKPKKSKGLIEAFISPRKQLPSRRSLEESMIVTGSTVSAQAKLQKANRPMFAPELSPPSLDDEEAPSPTRPKRKASKPLPITVLPPEDLPSFDANYHFHGYPPFTGLEETDPTAEHSKLLKFRSKRVRPGVASSAVDSIQFYDWARPPSPVSSVGTRRNSLESDMLPLPVLAEKLEEHLRSPSTDSLTLATLPLSPASTKATGETFCAFERRDLKIVLVTPPPSACGDCSRATSEPVETKDGEIAQLGVTEAQTLLASDPESDRLVLAVEVPPHVKEFVMGSWSKKRAVRMQNLFGDQIAKPTEPRSLRYQASQTPRRRASSSTRNPLPRRTGNQAHDFVELAKDTVRSGVRQLRSTVSFALQSEPTDETVDFPENIPKRKSFTLLTKPNPNPSPSYRRRHRASSAGPAGRRSSTTVSMKRTLTAPPKDTLEQSRSWLRGQSKARVI